MALHMHRNSSKLKLDPQPTGDGILEIAMPLRARGREERRTQNAERMSDER
jgi:hypothetical protein